MPFEYIEDKPIGSTFTPSPAEIEKTFPSSFSPPETPDSSTNPKIFSVISEGMEKSFNAASVGEDFYRKPQSLSGSEEREEPIYDAPDPVKAWSNEDIAGIREESVEEVLSRRGLPKVSSANTSLDILGLPKPDLTPYEVEPKNSPRQEEEVSKEKAKIHFMDMFK